MLRREGKRESSIGMFLIHSVDIGDYFIHLFMHSLNNYECLLNVKKCFRHWKYNNKQKDRIPSRKGGPLLVDKEKKIIYNFNNDVVKKIIYNFQNDIVVGLYNHINTKQIIKIRSCVRDGWGGLFRLAGQGMFSEAKR